MIDNYKLQNFKKRKPQNIECPISNVEGRYAINLKRN
jgi:hypothetical protein